VPFDSRCEETPLCSQGTFNPGDNECEWVSVSSYQAAANYSCPNGGTLNGTTCSGTYAATLVTVGAGNFDTPVYNHSQSGFSLCDANGTLGIHNTCYCTQPTGYIASGAFNAAIPVYNHSAGGFTICDANGELGINNTFNCSQAAGYVATEAFQGAVPVYNHSLGGFSFCDANSELGINNTFNCSKATAYMAPSQGTYGGTTSYSCNAGDTLTGTTCTHTYLAAATFTCNSGDNLSGTTCYHNTLNQISPVCPSGQMDYAHHVCFAAYTPQCPAGMTLDSVSGLCAQPATCANGLLDAAKNVCYQGSAASCPAPWTLDTANGICSSLPVCADGTFDATSGQCLATVVQDCGTYTWNAADGKCIQAVNCPRDPSFSENNTTGFSATLHECVSQAEHDCVLQTSYNGLPVEKCEAVPVCSGSGVFDPVQHACVMGNACPLGSQYACMDYNGSLQCSQNQCIDPANPPGGQTVDQGEDTMLEDDARNPDGSCAGQIMIFNGKASRCRPPGLTVGMMNDCCKSDKFTSEDTGDQVMGAVTTAKAVYQIGEVAYYTYEMYSGAMDFAQVGEAVSSAGESVISSVGAAEEAMAGGADMATGMADAMGEYMSAMCGPQMVVGLVVMVVMKILMGGGCDQRDIQCGEMTAARECHYLGDYCEKHWFYGCVQMAKGYCCFDSMMARIIQEQGRPQLTAFGPTGSWGTPDQPNCRGFTPEEFEAIDFAGIDFSEYISVIQQNLSTKIQDAQTTIGTTIQNRVNQITK
jgi:conjugal transfer mating pair stabilization protein TraN